MSGSFALYGVLFLVASTVGGIVEVRLDGARDDKKDPEKKPNILKDYICLRDGELCHPNFFNNRGLYVSCSNGIAWEQTCPKCSYHPLTCPTKSLWFDGEKCEWASPKLASQPCIDRIPTYDIHNGTSKDEVPSNSVAEIDPFLQSLSSAPLAQMTPNVHSMKEQLQLNADKSKWASAPHNSILPQPLPHYKSPKFEVPAPVPSPAPKAKVEEEDSSTKLSHRKFTPEIVEADLDENEQNDPSLPSFISADEGTVGSKIVRLNEPVYALVDSPDGSGKQVLVRVPQPFVFEDESRSLLPYSRSLLPNSRSRSFFNPFA